jgi:hypothetical protein
VSLSTMVALVPVVWISVPAVEVATTLMPCPCVLAENGMIAVALAILTHRLYL